MITVVEYIWLGGNDEFRSKARSLTLPLNYGVNDIPDWDYDGSSTKQAEGQFSEIILKAVAIFKDPFRGAHHLLVWCSTHKPDGTALSNNNRPWANELFEQKLDEEPWYGMEQEYFIIDSDTKLPVGFLNSPGQGQYYCSVGTGNAICRHIADEHYDVCLKAGVTISGINAEVAPGQWEYQIGPCTGIDAGDHMWIARYLMERVAEKHNVLISLHPKPVLGDWNGSGCHTNYSTKRMREVGGIKEIYSAVNKLALKHEEHIALYGQHNEMRLSGIHETSSMSKFSWGVANRGSSVRVGTRTEKAGCGYFEDRRPSSNVDPYLVTGKIFKTTVLDSYDLDV